MSKRIDIAKADPKALTAMLSIESYLEQSGLDKPLRQLIKMRASMINQCAYCIDMHTDEALSVGIEQKKLFAIAAWKESPLFDQKEQALLALTDEMTLIANAGVSDETYQQCEKLFGEKALPQIIMQIVMINAWNRYAISSGMTHA
ncbi:carboxymuconolactone decarboxylase family protein [Vibrio amylolyticus]|uniref:carboxymuconolactone decarboxylase family protein n=1 Tax=Vibrio amylolyticus TaxID=2847292 RepID=UPI003550E0D8